MLRSRDATVTQCHSRTKNLPEIVSAFIASGAIAEKLTWLVFLSLRAPVGQVRQADIVVSAIGKPQFVQGSWLKPGAVVIDVGTNYIPG